MSIRISSLRHLQSTIALAAASILFAIALAAGGHAQVPVPEVIPPLKPLTGLRPPEPPNLGDFIRNTAEGRAALLILGKSLFWDMSIGSDDVQSCASCHFSAGADPRSKNQLNPNLTNADAALGQVFDRTASGGAGGPNYQLRISDFPFHILANPADRQSAILFTTNDVASSMGVFESKFDGIVLPRTAASVEQFLNVDPTLFHVGGIHTRKVEPRQTPTVINAAFNFRNFWDGRANNIFNGVDPFGRRNPNARILVSQVINGRNTVVPTEIGLINSSAASQAVGPPLSSFEMSAAGRTFVDIAMKVLERKVLRSQKVDPTDSVLGPYADTLTGRGLVCTTRAVGPIALRCKTATDPISLQAIPLVVRLTYSKLIKLAFQDKYWDVGTLETPPFNQQIEENFSLFWGLAIQFYESTLISDQAPLDAFLNGDANALSDQEKRGMAIFQGKGLCINCHKGPDLTGAGIALQAEAQEHGLVERMIMGDDKVALYDNGFYNIGVVPTANDRGVGGRDPFNNPLSFTRQFLKMVAGQNVPDPFQVDPCTFEVDPCVPVTNPNHREAVDGAFKTAGLRNIELTAPYFHNGGYLTLESVVEFYNRGGNRRGGATTDTDTTGFGNNGSNLDADIRNLGLTAREQADLVAFLKRPLTDPRVTFERAPFDHPSLRVPNGHVGNEKAVVESVILGVPTGRAEDIVLEIPAVGAAGRATPIKPFSPVR